MMLALACLPLLLAAQANPAPPTTDALRKSSAPAAAPPGKAAPSNAKTLHKPDIALIEYLGEYGDAADGLDPLGLAEHPMQNAPMRTDKPGTPP